MSGVASLVFVILLILDGAYSIAISHQLSYHLIIISAIYVASSCLFLISLLVTIYSLRDKLKDKESELVALKPQLELKLLAENQERLISLQTEINRLKQVISAHVAKEIKSKEFKAPV